MTRLFLLLPLWLVFAVGEPSLVHQCPMHDAGASQHGVGSPQLAATHAEHSPAEHQPAAPPTAPHHGCSCIGSCTTAAAAVVPVAASVPAVAVELRAPRAPGARLLMARFEAERLLPFANGPPATRG